MVRCKFRVSSVKISETPDGKQADILMYPVCDDKGENAQYWKYTPGGQLQINCVNEAAFSQFDEGKEYYLDIHLAEAPAMAEVPAATEVPQADEIPPAP